MRGSSGASVTPFGHLVSKIGTRSREQGEWLLAHPSPALPKVHTVGWNGYTMETLQEVSLENINVRRSITGIAVTLVNNIWNQEAEVKFDMEAHLLRLDPLMEFVDKYVFEALSAVYTTLNWASLKACLTHGDPIMDNVMRRGTQTILIDPLPAIPAIPDLKCVDLGKLIQSGVGYEAVRYDLDLTRMPPSEFKKHFRKREEYLASMYWGVIHCLRAMGHVDGAMAEKIYRECAIPIYEEMKAA